MPTSDLLAGLAALIISFFLLTYLVADNPFYRIVSHLFIGVSAGYIALLAWYTVLQPQLFAPLLGGAGGSPLGSARQLFIEAVGLVGGLLLLLKSAHVLGSLGTWVVALMVGVGVAVAVGGGLTGTLIPQTAAAMVTLWQPGAGGHAIELFVEAVFAIVGTLTTLGFFYYGGRAEPGSPVDRPTLVKPVAAVGQVFIGAAFGMMYAGALAASVAIFAARLGDLWNFVGALLK